MNLVGIDIEMMIAAITVEAGAEGYDYDYEYEGTSSPTG